MLIIFPLPTKFKVKIEFSQHAIFPLIVIPEILVAIRVVMGGPKPFTVLALMVNE